MRISRTYSKIVPAPSNEDLNSSEGNGFVSKWGPRMPSKASEIVRDIARQVSSIRTIPRIAVFQTSTSKPSGSSNLPTKHTDRTAAESNSYRQLLLCLWAEKRKIFVLLTPISLLILLIHSWNEASVEIFGTNPYNDTWVSNITTEIKRSNPQIISNNTTNSSSSAFEDFDMSSVTLPLILNNIADLNLSLAKYDVPFLFHIPRSGGTTIEDIMGACVGLVVASSSGAQAGQDVTADDMEIFRAPWGSTYVNVDASSIDGIIQMRETNFIQGAGLGNLITSPYFYQVSSLFNKQQKARMFTMMRHPVQRATSLFYSQEADTLSNDGSRYLLLESNAQHRHLSIERWARTSNDNEETNWITRRLANVRKGEKLTKNHLEFSKKILLDKCLIGLLEFKDESVERFLAFFHLELESTKARECAERLLHWGWPKGELHHPVLEEGSPAYNLIAEMNSYDMELYEFSRKLFLVQSDLFRT